MADSGVTHVQVFGPPDCGTELEDARLCSDPDKGETVIYHCEVREIRQAASHGSRWWCMQCGENTPVAR